MENTVNDVEKAAVQKLATAKAVSGNETVTGDHHVTGNQQVDGTLAVTGAADFEGALNADGAITGLQTLVAGGVAYTVGSAPDGDAVIQTATDNAVITLPNAAAGNKGQRVTVQNTGADGAAKVSISPHSSDKIKGGVHGAATGDLVSFSGTADKDAINTKATAKSGDYLVLVCDGVDTWWVIGGKGVWASEA